MKTMKKMMLCVMCVAAVVLCAACGKKDEGGDQLEGSLTDIMAGLYEQADLSEDFRAGMDSYSEGVASIPMISPNAYQCVLLRVEEDKVDTVKQQLKDNADLNKWVCVSAETMLIESRGNVIFFIMGDNDTVYAMNGPFQRY